MIRAAWATLPALAVLAAGTAEARTVDYGISEAEFREAAAAIGAPAPAAAPTKGSWEVVLEGADRLDHRLMILGISCSAWQVDNPLSQMVRRALSAWDADGLLEPVEGRPSLYVIIGDARSDIRCVELRQGDAPCIVRTRINGEIRYERRGSRSISTPFSIEDEQVNQSPGACGSLSRGTGLSGRAASYQLVKRLQELAAEQ